MIFSGSFSCEKTMLKQYLIYLSILLPITVIAEPTITFISPSQQTTLLELYTSEGCSSCPPADKWLSTLKDDPRLWKEIIPIAFHVDYWDYLGWKDTFSRAEYSQRQRNYAQFNRLQTVYTPGFLQNGQEWRRWFGNRTLNANLGKTVGRLEVSIVGNNITARFRPKKAITGPLQLNVAWLGFNLATEVQNGENEGKVLKHDFVSLGTRIIHGISSNNTYHWQFNIGNTIGNTTTDSPDTKGAAFWVTNGSNPTPIQATGGWM